MIKYVLVNLFEKLHNKLGDFWWYSLMLFFAARAADCLNVFVGLWLVPKYVEPSELGAVMPLTQFATFLALPIAVFASTFRNELNSLVVERKFGQIKTLMRSIFIASAIFLFLAIIISRLVLPAFLERIRIAEGSLCIVILISSFIGTISPIYANALQTLKKFKANSFISLLGAPIRFVTMLITMPFRALTGYFVGQTTPSAFCIAGSIFALRKELSIKAEPYWNRNIIKRFAIIFFLIGIWSVATEFANLTEATILRQRLPELDSAAYYMVTRFSDIAGFLATALAFTLFPYATDLAAKGKDRRPLIIKVALIIISSNALLALFFWAFGERILSLLPHGEIYSQYWWAIPWMIVIPTLLWLSRIYTTGEIAAFNYGFLKWMIPVVLIYPTSLLLVTGHGYFDAYLPTSWVNFLTQHNIYSLKTMLIWITGNQLLRVICCGIAILRQKRAA